MMLPLLDIPLYSQFWADQGANLVTNGDFEGAAGPPPAGWTALNAICTREAGTRSPYVGQVAYDGVNATGRMYQATGAAAGRRYTLTGWGRTDGVATGSLVPDGSPVTLPIAASTTWQVQQSSFVAVGANLNLFASSLAAGRYAQFDDVSLYERFLYTQNRGALGVTPATQRVQLGDGRTAATFPTMLPFTQAVRKGMNFDGGDYMVYTPAVANGTYTVCMLMQRLSAGANQYLFDARAGGGTGYCYYTGAALSAGSGTIYVDDVATSTMNFGQLVLVSVAGVTLSGPSGMVFFASNAPPGAAMTGTLLGAQLWPGTLTPRQLSYIKQNMLAEAFGP